MLSSLGKINGLARLNPPNRPNKSALYPLDYALPSTMSKIRQSNGFAYESRGRVIRSSDRRPQRCRKAPLPPCTTP